MPDVLLCIPPDYGHNYPPLATPALCAFLKRGGIDVSQVDLNLRYRDFLCSRISAHGLNEAEKKLLLNQVLGRFFHGYPGGKYYSFLLPESGRHPPAGLPYGNNSNSSFYFTERILNSRALFRYLRDAQENTFLQFFIECGIIGELAAGKTKVLGISIISPSQAIAAFTLGFLVKRSLPEIHVTIGGQWPTLFRRQIKRRKDLFACFDSVILFEGETPLLRLVRSLSAGKPAVLPNVMLSGGRMGPEVNARPEDMNGIPCPDFSGLPLREYDGSDQGHISLTYETSRGCYWSKCAYCVDLPLPKPLYRSKDPRLVLQDIRELKEKYNASNLLLGDPGLSPRQMLGIAGRINRSGIKIDWWTMARLDPGFNPRIFRQARKAGLWKINFGFESACDRVCALVDKGNTRDCSERVIRDCHDAGIMVDLQTMIGLPGETLEDGLETVDFLIRNRRYITNVTFNSYYLTPGNYVYLRPGRYGISYLRPEKLPFRFFVPFRNLKGMSEGQVRAVIDAYYTLLDRNEKPPGEKKTEYRGKAGIPHTGGNSGTLAFSLCGRKVRLRYRRSISDGQITVE